MHRREVRSWQGPHTWVHGRAARAANAHCAQHARLHFRGPTHKCTHPARHRVCPSACVRVSADPHASARSRTHTRVYAHAHTRILVQPMHPWASAHVRVGPTRGKLCACPCWVLPDPPSPKGAAGICRAVGHCNLGAPSCCARRGVAPRGVCAALWNTTQQFGICEGGGGGGALRGHAGESGRAAVGARTTGSDAARCCVAPRVCTWRGVLPRAVARHGVCAARRRNSTNHLRSPEPQRNASSVYACARSIAVSCMTKATQPGWARCSY